MSHNINVAKLKQISDKIKTIVYGYMHDIIRRLSLELEIPTEIINLCVLFYHKHDRFDTKWISKAMRVEGMDNDRIITIKNACTSSFLELITERGRHEWKFKIYKLDGSYCGILIGIWKVRENVSPPIDTYFTEGGNAGYGFHGQGKLTNGSNGSTKDLFGIKCKEGSIIEMILDYNNLSLSYIIDGVNYGKAFDVDNAKYRAAVYTCSEGDIVQLLDE